MDNAELEAIHHPGPVILLAGMVPERLRREKTDSSWKRKHG
jgi:hypothetical protein